MWLRDPDLTVEWEWIHGLEPRYQSAGSRHIVTMTVLISMKNTITTPIAAAVLLGTLSLALLPSRHAFAQRTVHAKHRAPVSHRQASHVHSGDFPVFAFRGAATRGDVHVTQSGSQTNLTVQLSGLAPMTVHATHIHAGSCANAYGGFHLYILGYLRANAFGSGSVQGFGPSLYVPYSRYVIVYAGVNPFTIIGCANLGPLTMSHG